MTKKRKRPPQNKPKGRVLSASELEKKVIEVTQRPGTLGWWHQHPLRPAIETCLRKGVSAWGIARVLEQEGHVDVTRSRIQSLYRSLRLKAKVG